MNGHSDKILYRPCVGILLLNKENLVFVGERIDTPGAWQMPQGGIDHHEDVRTAAIRELKEEIGTDNVEIIRIAQKKLRYDLPETMRAKLWNGAYRGQEQTWVAARYIGEDRDICLTAHAPPEFSDWKWVSLSETLPLIVPFKREIYTQVIEMFKDLAHLSPPRI